MLAADTAQPARTAVIMKQPRRHRWNKPDLHRGSVCSIVLVLVMFLTALGWVRTHAPSVSELRAVAGTQR